MKLNHAQRKHLIAKFTADVKAKLDKQKDPAGPLFEITVPCKVKIGIVSWYRDCDPVSVHSASPPEKVWKAVLTPAQKRVVELAVAAKKAHQTKGARGEALIASFEEQLLFADGGLDEANALIAAFLKKL